MARGWWANGEHAEPPLDSGLQAERTAMAWQRTALGVAGVSALLLHHTGGRTVAAAPPVLGLLTALALLLATERRYVRTVRRIESGEPATSRTLVRLVSAVAVLMAVSAVAIVVLGG